MNFRISIFLVAVFFILNNFTFASDLKNPQKLITFQEKKLLTFVAEFSIDNPPDLEAMKVIVKSINNWLKCYKIEKTEKFVFLSIGRESHQPSGLDEETMALHKNPQKCYQNGNAYLQSMDIFPSDIWVARVWFKRAADLNHELSQVKLKALDGLIKTEIQRIGLPDTGAIDIIFEYLGYE
jgi:hypothetical protein